MSSSTLPGDPPLVAVVLAAGKGTRMRSDLPKVVHAAAGQPMVRWVVEACRGVGAAPVILVVGHRAEDVRAIFAGEPDIRFALQTEQRGTGHAVLAAESLLLEAAPDPAATDCLVLYGDGPLIRAGTLRTLVDRHRRSGAAATLATAVIPDPTGYGRILRDDASRFVAIREQKDADAAELAVREINPGYYCFRVADLLAALRGIGTANASGELYLTDVFERLLAAGRRVEVVDAVPAEDVLSVNTPEQLATVERILLARTPTGTGAAPASAAPVPPHRHPGP